jgi:hypothetical protein
MECKNPTIISDHCIHHFRFYSFIVGYKEAFWFPLAAGTIGGLIMSFVSVFFILPVFLFEKNNDVTKLQ